MRTGTLLRARVPVIGVFATVLVSCAPSVIDRTLAERPVFVEIPTNGVATPAQKARYENNPATVERYEGRCTYKPAAGATCTSFVTLKITVVEGAKSAAVGGHGGRPLLLALIENKGANATFDGILPGTQALVAVNKPGTTRETAVTLVRFQQMINSPNFSVSAREYGVLRQCQQHYPATSSDMSFRGCNPKHWAMTGNGRPGVFATSLVTAETQHSFLNTANGGSAPDLADFASLDDPLWLRCTPGCCTS